MLLATGFRENKMQLTEVEEQIQSLKLFPVVADDGALTVGIPVRDEESLQALLCMIGVDLAVVVGSGFSAEPGMEER